MMLIASGAWILVLAYFSLSIYVLVRSMNTPQYRLGCVFLCLPILFIILANITGRWPVLRKLSPKDIYGVYRIDRGFYPGPNADWQYEHYQFEIKVNTLTLTEIDDDGARHQYPWELVWSDVNTRRALWSAKKAKKHHLHFESPQLFRSYGSFYYVIRSDKFGNMFFRKEGDFFRREYLLGFVVIPMLLWGCRMYGRGARYPVYPPSSRGNRRSKR